METLSEILSQYRDILNGIVKESERFLEKWIMNICSGVLAISTAIIPLCLGENKITHSILLISSWIFLVVGLVVCLISHFVAKYAAQNIISYLDDVHREKDIDCINCKIIRRNKFIDSLNILCVVLVLLGLVILCAFMYINFII